jgi:hypothetical protein
MFSIINGKIKTRKNINYYFQQKEIRSDQKMK